MGPRESHEKKVSRKNPNMGLQAILIRVNVIYIHNTFELRVMKKTLVILEQILKRKGPNNLE